MLGVVYRTISGHLLREARLTRRAGHTGAVTLTRRNAERLGRMLERRGLIERDAESAWLSRDPAEVGVLDDPIGHSITYRIAVGPRADQKVFSLHAGLEIQPGERAKLERLAAT